MSRAVHSTLKQGYGDTTPECLRPAGESSRGAAAAAKGDQRRPAQEAHHPGCRRIDTGGGHPRLVAACRAVIGLIKLVRRSKRVKSASDPPPPPFFWSRVIFVSKTLSLNRNSCGLIAFFFPRPGGRWVIGVVLRENEASAFQRLPELTLQRSAACVRACVLEFLSRLDRGFDLLPRSFLFSLLPNRRNWELRAPGM